MSNPSSLPPYVESRDLGESSVLPPGRFQGVTSYAFAIQGRADLMEALARRQLTDATGGAWEASVLGSTILVMLNYARRLTSPAANPGWTENYEATVTFPVVLKRAGMLHPARLLTWTPYIFIDNSRAMCTGRESWGYAKAVADIAIPPAPAKADAWSVRTMVFPEFTPDTQGTRELLLDLRRTDAPSDHPSIWTEVAEFGDWLLGQATHGVRDLELAADVLADWSRGAMPVVNLKQFRDAADGTRACYQALVTSPIAVKALRGGGLLTGDYALRILPCASHPMVEQFGLQTNADGTIPVLGGAYVEWDFDAIAGEVLWEAPRE